MLQHSFLPYKGSAIGRCPYMARRKISIDEKIEKAQADVASAKERYDEALATLKLLLDKKNALKK